LRAVKLQNGKLEFDADSPEPTVPVGSVRVRVLQAGICETDLQLVAGYMGFEGVLGHEFVGIAESGRFVGQRVVGEINCVCNDCDRCRNGHGNHCPNRTVIGILNHDGAFADYVVVPEANLHVVPDAISDDEATLVEPIAAALRIPEQVDLYPGMRCVVVGDGRLGNLCAQTLLHAKCEVTVVGKHADKLKTFQRMGIQTCLLADKEAILPAQLAVDCAGSSSGLQTAISLVQPLGTVVMKTTVVEEHSLALAPIVIDEIQVVGSRCGPFDKAIQSLLERQFQLNDFVSGRYPIEQFGAAFAHAKEKNALKLILKL